MKVEIDIPKGQYCADCCRLSDFWVNEMECTNCEGVSPKYIRAITAQCTLFNQTVRGVALAEMYKCGECLDKTK